MLRFYRLLFSVSVCLSGSTVRAESSIETISYQKDKDVWTTVLHIPIYNIMKPHFYPHIMTTLEAVCVVQLANVVISKATGAPCVTFHLITWIVCRSVGPFHSRKLGQTIQAFVFSSLADLSYCKQLPGRWAVSTQALLCWLSEKEDTLHYIT